MQQLLYNLFIQYKMIIKVIQSKPNNGIPVWEIYSLGKITTNLQSLINQGSIAVYSNSIPILSVQNQDNSVNQYLFKDMSFESIQNQDYIIDKTILESDLVLFSENYKTSVSIINVDNYSNLPEPFTVNNKYYFVLNKQGTSWLPGNLGGTFYNNGIYYSNGVNWIYMTNPYQATQQSVNEGLITDQFVTPVTLNNFNKWVTKQDVLISNTNIKTINGLSILGPGDVAVTSVSNLSTSQTEINVTINSEVGTDATIPLGNGINAGVTINDYTNLEKQKLLNIQSNATSNNTDNFLLNRTNHTSTQLANTISNFQTTVSTNTDVTANTAVRHTHSNKTILDLISEAFTTVLKNNYDSAYNWVITNGTNVLNHLIRLDNPHSVTKSQVGLNNVDNTSDLSKPVSTSQQTVLNTKANISGQVFTGNISATNLNGNNTGDQSSIVGITGTKSQFDTSITDGNIQFVGDAPTVHNHILLNGATDVTITATNLNTLDDGLNTNLHFHDSDRNRSNHTGTQTVSTITGLGSLATQSGTFSGTSSGVNTGDETLISIQEKRPLKTINGNSLEGSGNIVISGGGGGVTLISNNVVFDFGNEQDFKTIEILNSSISNSNLKSFTIIPVETSETSLDDFNLNGLNFNISNIIDNVSFNITANALNNASGNYTIKYLITI
jgi:hypothetical protein